MAVYYNEIDEAKAEWLRENIKAGLIAPGEVDERSIADVQPEDLRGFEQCHFFAGIGIWSYALRLAGWPDARPVWTGSCPCQPFSVSGKRAGGADDRHLWPHWARLIRQSSPAEILGEQVEAAVRHGWFDLVSDDLEAAGYAVGAVAFPACSVGAPHIRQRLYFGAYAEHAERRTEREIDSNAHLGNGSRRSCHDGEMHMPDRMRLSESRYRTGSVQQRMSDSQPVSKGSTGLSDPRRERAIRPEMEGEPCSGSITFSQRSATERSADAERDGGRTDFPLGQAQGRAADGRDCATGERVQSNRAGLLTRREAGAPVGHGSTANAASSAGGGDHSLGPRLEGLAGHESNCGKPGWLGADEARLAAASGATRGFWAGCDWWWGRDGKYRPIKPGLFPLAHGVAARVLKLRGAGDGIVATQAAMFAKAWQEVRAERTLG